MNKFLIISAFLLFWAASGNSQTPPVEDIQFWNETTVTVPLIKAKDARGKEFDRISLFFNGVLRVGDNVKRPVDERIGFGFDFKLNKYVGITPSYLYAVSLPVKGRRDYESRFRFAVNLEKKFKKFTLRDRNLVEYRMRNSRSDSTRYRNRFQLLYPVVREGKELFTPYFYDEVFYDFQAKAWTRNEISAGLSRKINKNLTTEFFYLLRNNKGNTLKYVNIFGVNLKIRVD